MIKLVRKIYSVCLGECISEYVVDSDADFAKLPKSAPTSTAISPSGKIKIVNASGEWVAFGEG